MVNPDLNPDNGDMVSDLKTMDQPDYVTKPI